MLPRDILAFDEGERILIVSFLGKSLSKVLRTISGIGRHFGLADWLAGWLAGYVAQIALISRANVFLAALSLRHRFFFLCAISEKKILLLEIECTLLRWFFPQTLFYISV